MEAKFGTPDERIKKNILTLDDKAFFGRTPGYSLLDHKRN